MSAEQREHTRYKVRWKARLLLPDKSLFKISIRNVSKGGVGLNFHEALASRSKVQIEFIAPCKGEMIKIRAVCIVAHQTILSENQGVNVGLKFAQMTLEDMHSLANALQELSDRLG
jgi:c-di-GMP-binding flagellar brake protein YcgR